MRRFTLVPSFCLFCLVFAAPAAIAQELKSCKVYEAASLQSERVGNVTRLHGTTDFAVQIDCDGMQFSADYIEVDSAADSIRARGHVVFVSGGNRISADRMEFDTKTRTGIFFNAFGTATLGERAEDRSLFGTQEPDAYFWGDELRKLGPKKYRIVRGGFTTCVQPTPRWEITSGSVTLNLDDYALLRNSVFRVKGVPLMYLPLFYYPIQEDDRATGFLLPTYGASTIGGQSISNAFFWAIGRSHDATAYHTWLSKTGQSYGGEYRYVVGPGAQGNARMNFVDEHEASYRLPDGTERQTLPRRSYSIAGDLSQPLPLRMRARGSVDYFSSIATQQKYQQNIHQMTNRTRRFGANVSGAWGTYVLNATFDRNDIFYNESTLTTTGSLPRVSISRGERPIGRTPLYFGVSGESASILRSTTTDDVKTQDMGLTRLEMAPVLRVPFRRWSFLTVNSSLSWRATYWTESLDPRGMQISEGIGRRYFDLQSRITGPVFNRVWNTPGNGYAEKFKHVIEPTLTIQRVTAIDEFDRIVKLDGGDYQKGKLTRYVYGVSNRLYAKKGASREIASVTVSQSYYTDADAAQYDRLYQSSFSGRARTHFTPVALYARTSPTDRLQADFRTEWDPTVHTLRTLAASGTYSQGDWLTTSAGWSQRRFIKELPGFDNPASADHYLNAAANIRGFRNHLGGTYAFNYDLRRDRFLQQRFTAYYNAQCCGIGVEYQTYNLTGTFTNIGVPQDRRFNLSFTLAGIGTFSNLFGAFGGQQGR